MPIDLINRTSRFLAQIRRRPKTAKIATLLMDDRSRLSEWIQFESLKLRSNAHGISVDNLHNKFAWKLLTLSITLFAIFFFSFIWRFVESEINAISILFYNYLFMLKCIFVWRSSKANFELKLVNFEIQITLTNM